MRALYVGAWFCDALFRRGFGSGALKKIPLPRLFKSGHDSARDLLGADSKLSVGNLLSAIGKTQRFLAVGIFQAAGAALAESLRYIRSDGEQGLPASFFRALLRQTNSVFPLTQSHFVYATIFPTGFCHIFCRSHLLARCQH